jgi:hypothetical protein
VTGKRRESKGRCSAVGWGREGRTGGRVRGRHGGRGRFEGGGPRVVEEGRGRGRIKSRTRRRRTAKLKSLLNSRRKRDKEGRERTEMSAEQIRAGIVFATD